MSSEQYIDGIHNYCDRWCERCPQSVRCRVYHDSETDRRRHVRRGEDPDSTDVAMKDVGRNLAKAHRLLIRFARREGIDLDELAKDAPSQPAGATADGGGMDLDSHTRRRTRPADLPLIDHADTFMTGCRDLLNQLRPAFDESADDVNRRGGFMDVAGESELLGRVRDGYEVLCWDHTLVAVKLRRALSASRQAEEQAANAGLRADFAFDSAGSGAVVRRSLLRCQAALRLIYDWDETLQGPIIELLATAERLLRGLEARIPQCTNFQWPPPPMPGDDRVH